MSRPPKEIWWVLALAWGAAALAHFVLLGPYLGEIARTAAAFVVLGFTPGLLLVTWLLARDRALTWGDRLLYAGAAGYALWIWGVLFFSYLPGPITQAGILAASDLASLLFSVLAVVSAARARPADAQRTATGANRWLWLGIVALVGVAFFFRFANLGYSEFQGDEAKVMLHAVAAIQGREDVLFDYRKGPTEIIIPAGLLAVTGGVDEGTARMPFALATVICLLAVFRFGWRLFGALAGWLGAMLLAVDGYLIGYPRIVQYPSLIFLMGVFTLLPLARLAFPTRREAAADAPIFGYVLLSALFAAAGSVTHYEGALVTVPALYLVWLIWRRTDRRKPLVAALVTGGVLGGALLTAFYLPFIRHPAFTVTVDRLTSDVVGESAAIYNRLDLFVSNGIFYNTIVAFALFVAATVGAIALAVWRGRRYRLPLLLALGSAGVLALLLAVQPGAPLYAFLLTAIVLLTPIALPTTPHTERVIWLWFSISFLLTAFFLQDPNTHFYVFSIPWMMLCGLFLARLWRWILRTIPRPAAGLLGAGLLASAAILFGGYAYAFYILAPDEVVRHWDEQTVIPRWLMWGDPQEHALFGIPHYSGWREVDDLYADGALEGDYAASVRHWIPEWYIRHDAYCEESPRVVLIEKLERFDKQAELQAFMGEEFNLWGVVDAYGEPRIEIYRDQAVDPAAVAHIDAPAAPRAPSTADFEVVSTELLPPLSPSGVRFGAEIELVGYRLPRDVAQAGDKLPLTLAWRALKPLEHNYTLFVQVLGAADRKAGQLDTPPSCNAGPTHQWNAGEMALGYYEIPLFAGEAPGVYSLQVGLYENDTRDRLEVFAATGEPMGDALPIADITLQ